jgi:hypothetical protein
VGIILSDSFLPNINIEADHHHDDAEENLREDGDELPGVDLLEIIPLVDAILSEDDKDKDGYISWPEFMARQGTIDP